MSTDLKDKLLHAQLRKKYNQDVIKYTKLLAQAKERLSMLGKG